MQPGGRVSPGKPCVRERGASAGSFHGHCSLVPLPPREQLLLDLGIPAMLQSHSPQEALVSVTVKKAFLEDSEVTGI